MLGLDTRSQVNALVKEHHVPLEYTGAEMGRPPRPTRPRNPTRPMIVVADSGALHNLIPLEQVDLLRRFYGQVVVPEAVTCVTTGRARRSEGCAPGCRRPAKSLRTPPARCRLNGCSSS